MLAVLVEAEGDLTKAVGGGGAAASRGGGAAGAAAQPTAVQRVVELLQDPSFGGDEFMGGGAAEGPLVLGVPREVSLGCCGMSVWMLWCIGVDRVVYSSCACVQVLCLRLMLLVVRVMCVGHVLASAMSYGVVYRSAPGTESLRCAFVPGLPDAVRRAADGAAATCTPSLCSYAPPSSFLLGAARY